MLTEILQTLFPKVVESLRFAAGFRGGTSGFPTWHVEHLLVVSWTQETLSVPAGSSACGEGDEGLCSFIQDLARDMMDLQISVVLQSEAGPAVASVVLRSRLKI